MSRLDTAIKAAAGVTVLGLAGIAGAISYSHMTELAQQHGETGWRGHMFPLSVDGIEIVASLVLLADKRAGRPSGRLPCAALVAGTGASFAANMAVGGSDWIGWAVSGWPAFALLVAIKLLFKLLERPASEHQGNQPGSSDDQTSLGLSNRTAVQSNLRLPGAGRSHQHWTVQPKPNGVRVHVLPPRRVPDGRTALSWRKPPEPFTSPWPRKARR